CTRLSLCELSPMENGRPARVGSHHCRCMEMVARPVYILERHTQRDRHADYAIVSRNGERPENLMELTRHIEANTRAPGEPTQHHSVYRLPVSPGVARWFCHHDEERHWRHRSGYADLPRRREKIGRHRLAV